MWVLVRKELADHFNSTRFLICLSLVVAVAVLTTNAVSLNINEALKSSLQYEYLFLLLFTLGGQFFSFVQFVTFFGPLIGIIMGFDAINREKNEGTLIKILSQPIYRDSVINSKFLAGIITVTVLFLAIMLLISGMGMIVIGVVPTMDEIMRLILFFIVTVIYVSFWMGIAIFFSIVFRSVGTSALASIAVWIAGAFLIKFIASTVADIVSPVQLKTFDAIYKNARIQEVILRFSPLELYDSSSSMLLVPHMKTTKSLILIGPLERLSMSRFSHALPVSQSCLMVLPHIITLLSMTTICFAISYIKFMRQEIRPA